MMMRRRRRRIYYNIFSISRCYERSIFLEGVGARQRVVVGGEGGGESEWQGERRKRRGATASPGLDLSPAARGHDTQTG